MSGLPGTFRELRVADVRAYTLLFILKFWVSCEGTLVGLRPCKKHVQLRPAHSLTPRSLGALCSLCYNHAPPTNSSNHTFSQHTIRPRTSDS